ncbi:tetratricopeptide repeat protein [Thauera sinica]|uniref:tetratricopeptide repeat protein n=1 Tax=Thauera sp. K11 TaxID=2005884 RepID=UPI000BBA5A9E|nr:hypothetical protein [Thauera sp. K11]ATE60928.1 hypothetical protein CCZ27_14145 [Thauera sp. K11]
MRKEFRAFHLGLLLAAAASAAQAQHNPAGTAAEQAALPAFCQVKLRDENRSLEAQRYIAQFGFDNWLHLHHYCYGQNFLSRAAKAADAKDRSSQRRLATKEYEYVLRGVRPDFWMRPQLYVELGRIYQQLGDAARATGLFNDAIRVSPGYQAAYLALVAQLRQSGSGREALAVATEGLRNLPDSEALKKAYKELGGTEPFPSPVAGKSAPRRRRQRQLRRNRRSRRRSRRPHPGTPRRTRGRTRRPTRMAKPRKGTPAAASAASARRRTSRTAGASRLKNRRSGDGQPSVPIEPQTWQRAA